MKFLSVLFLILVLFLIQIAILPQIVPGWIIPNLLLVAAIFFSFYSQDYWQSLSFAFISGVLLDLYSGASFGVIFIPFLLIATLIDFSSRRIINKTNFATFGISIVAGTIFYFIFQMGLLKVYEILKVGDVDMFGGSYIIFLEIIAGVAAVNLLLAAIFYIPFKKIAIYFNE